MSTLRKTPARAALTDRQGRRLDYLRLALTDRCNLRCRYCMPAQGIELLSHGDMMSFEEAERLLDVFVGLGVRKLRLTGGEPLVRRGAPEFMVRLGRRFPDLELVLTTNGLLLRQYLPEIVGAGIRRINLSLDSLDPRTWSRLTRRSGHAEVMATIPAVQEAGLGLKINVVVLAGINDHELPAFVALTRDLPLEVRFIEAMAFDGSGGLATSHLPAADITARLAEICELEAIPARPTEVAQRYRVAGHAGILGIIAGHARTFCGTCNRLRLDTRGRLRTCLYGRAGTDLLALLRAGGLDQDVAAAIDRAVVRRHRDGHEAAAAAKSCASMASIGG